MVLGDLDSDVLGFYPEAIGLDVVDCPVIDAVTASHAKQNRFAEKVCSVNHNGADYTPRIERLRLFAVIVEGKIAVKPDDVKSSADAVPDHRLLPIEAERQDGNFFGDLLRDGALDGLTSNFL